MYKAKPDRTESRNRQIHNYTWKCKTPLLVLISRQKIIKDIENFKNTAWPPEPNWHLGNTPPSKIKLHVFPKVHVEHSPI